MRIKALLLDSDPFETNLNGIFLLGFTSKYNNNNRKHNFINVRNIY